jgi:phage FluMu gp28-like protein
VADGLVERINAMTKGRESREEWLARQRAECIDEEQWRQEYCCVPADEAKRLHYQAIARSDIPR